MVSQAEIHEMVFSEDPDKRKRASELLEKEFDRFEDKDTAWKELHGLTQDQDSSVRWEAAISLEAVFAYVPNREQAWKDLIRLTQDEDSDVRGRAAISLEAVFAYVPNREQAWKDLIRLTQDQDSNVRWRVAYSLGAAFTHVPHKEQAWKDLIKLTHDQDSNVRWEVARLLGAALVLFPNREQAWKDLHRLTQDRDRSVRGGAAESLGTAFTHVPNKEQAWKDLHRLTQDLERDVRRRATESLGAAFAYVPNKIQAWEGLIRLTQDLDSSVRWRAAESLGTAFTHVPNKEQAWKDLISLTQDQDSSVRWRAAESLGAAFTHVPHKERAWKDLIRLTQDQDSNVRWEVARSLGAAFVLDPNREQAWEDLHRLTQDQDNDVRRIAASSLGSAFQHVPDKKQAWEDLHRLTQDENLSARCTSYHSLGRISILMASEAEDNEFRTHLEEAIEFFRKSSEAASYINPAAFCLPFYRSLHSLLFTEVPKEEEVQRYLAEAEEAVQDSESREVLLEAVSNLSKALQEVRTYSIEDIISKKRDLKSYTKYCLKTAECLTEARANNPLASKIVDYALVELSIPIVDQKIKALFGDVEAAAGRLCRSTKGTKLEAFGKDAYESTRGLKRVDSWITADRYLENIVPLLKSHCNRLPEKAKAHLKTLIDSQDTATLEQRYQALESVLLAALVQGENDDRRVKELQDILSLHFKNIEFSILNLNTSSGNARKDFFDLKGQIEGLQKEIEAKGLNKEELATALEEKDRAMIERLKKMREDMLRAVRDTVSVNASKRDVETILEKLEAQDHLKSRDALGIIADISSLAVIALKILTTGSPA